MVIHRSSWLPISLKNNFCLESALFMMSIDIFSGTSYKQANNFIEEEKNPLPGLSCSCRWILSLVTGFGHCCNSKVTEILLALLWSLGKFLSIPHLLKWGLAGSFSSSHCDLPTYYCYFVTPTDLSWDLFPEHMPVFCIAGLCSFSLGICSKGIQNITGRWNRQIVMLWCRVKTSWR